jgi:hypothetical protein
LLGEPDPLKYLQIFPGIKQGREGSAGLYVRGGTPDQNLILLDGAPIYNINHFFGYLSVFNSDAIKNINVHKSSIPVEFEGRLSSVIDISMKEGNEKTTKKVFSLSPLSGSFLVEGPIIKNKTSYILSGRRTWLDGLYYLMKEAGSSDKGYNFYDLSAKIHHRINDKNDIYLSFYSGRDKFFDKFDTKDGVSSVYSFNWGNLTSLLRWSSELGKSSYLTTTAFYSKYNFSQQDQYNNDTIHQTRKVNSSIREVNLSSQLQQSIIFNQQLKIGINFSYKEYKPEIFQFVNGEAFSGKTIDPLKTSMDFSFYAEDKITVDKLVMTLGIRDNLYFQGSGAKNFIQPRINLTYNIGRNYNVQASYNRINQNIHLLTNSTLGQPTDLWLPATAKAPTESSDQLNLSASKNWKEYSASIALYYKEMKNLVEYKEGANLLYGIDEG